MFCFIPTVPYYGRVSVSLWTNVLYLILQSLSQDELETGKSLKLVQQHIMNVRGVADKPIGTVRTIKAMKVHPFQTTSVHRMTKVKRHCMRVNLIAESRGKSTLPQTVIMTPTYCSLEPGCLRVTVSLRNVSARTITIQAKTTTCQLQQGNVVPPIIHPNVEEDKKIVPVKNHPCLSVMMMDNGL